MIESAVDLQRVSEDMEAEFSRIPPLKISRLNKIDRAGRGDQDAGGVEAEPEQEPEPEPESEPEPEPEQ